MVTKTMWQLPAGLSERSASTELNCHWSRCVVFVGWFMVDFGKVWLFVGQEFQICGTLKVHFSLVLAKYAQN